ncbi:MAG: hypothetical protein A2Y24_06860 [Clostridiales bacterium GWE2_32_10]|nr:MAG: hypothetical protein A2Y24_06860 [Clostridiales bacterium GWE2_32_10]HBY19973.1 hypothetical protein [Clostridiales bacterium]
MRAGKLSNRMTIQKEIILKTENGVISKQWNDYVTVWTEIKNADKIVFRVRYISGVELKDRVRYKDKYFNILDVVNVNERNILLDITAKEIVKEE